MKAIDDMTTQTTTGTQRPRIWLGLGGNIKGDSDRQIFRATETPTPDRYSFAAASPMPCRFSDRMTRREANAFLREASFATPSLPNGGSRLFASVYRTLVYGRANAKGSVYVVNIFDRASPWISPRYAKSYSNESLRVVTADAVTWIEDRTAELHAMRDEVNTAIIRQVPFTADTQP